MMNKGSWNKTLGKCAITTVFGMVYIILFYAMYITWYYPPIFFSLGLPIIMMAMYHLEEWGYIEKYGRLR